MKSHLELNDHEFERLFEAGNFDPALFNHEAHLRFAWIHIRKYGEKTAIVNVTRQLKAFVIQLGAEDKYNETLTVAAVKAVSHFMKRTPEAGFIDLINKFPALKYHFRRLMECHYSEDIFTSLKARGVYLEPDLLPFD